MLSKKCSIHLQVCNLWKRVCLYCLCQLVLLRLFTRLGKVLSVLVLKWQLIIPVRSSARNSPTISFFYLGFLSRTFMNHRTPGKGEGHFINSSLPLPPASQTLRHQPGDYCRELTSAHSQQPDSKREPLVSERKSLTTKLQPTQVVSGLFHRVVYV